MDEESGESTVKDDVTGAETGESRETGTRLTGRYMELFQRQG